VDYRSVKGGHSGELTSRLDSLSTTGCTIHSRALPDTDVLELRIYLPDGEWPLRIDLAKVTWGHWDAFAVEFLSMPAEDRQRLQDYLLEAPAPVWM
jgi:hypothetical protein